MRRIVTGLVLVALLIGVLGACGPEPTVTDPKIVAENFLKAMGDHEPPEAYQTAYDLLSADTQATVSLEDFEKMVRDAWTDAGITAFEVKAVQEAILSKSGNRASVPYQASLTTREATTEVYNALSLVLQDGQWRVIWPPAR
jgi:hypothetical protein